MKKKWLEINKKINEKIDNNKENIEIFLVIFILATILCGIFLKFHKITDIYWVIEYGYEKYSMVALSDGRIINFCFLRLANWIGIPIENYLVLVNWISMLVDCISVYCIYNYLIKDEKEITKTKKILILIGSFLVIFNPMTVEHFAYSENIIMALSMLVCTKAAIILDKKQNKYIIKSILLMLFASIVYQGTLNLFITLSVFFLILKDKRDVKYYIKHFAIMLLILFLCFITMYISVIEIDKILDIKQTRLGRTNLFSIKTLKQVITLSWESVTLITYQLFPTAFIFFVMLISLILLAFQEKPINKLLKYIFLILIAIFSCIIPVFLQKTPSISARMCCSIGSIIGLSILYITMKAELKNNLYNLILIIGATLILCINIFDYWNIGVMNVITNEEEKKAVEQISKVIDNYENTNNIKIEKVTFCSDSHVTKTYNKMKRNTFTDRGLAVSYSAVHCLNYYMNRNFELTNMDKYIYNLYFKGNNWNEFAPEQVQFKENVAYICIY